MTKMRDSMPVVFAVLAGIFLLMIIFQWGGQGTLFAPTGDAGVLALVNGYPITQGTYNKILETVTTDMKTKNKVPNLNESDEADAEENAWDQAVSQAIIDQSIEKMGIIVTDQEIRDVMFNNPPEEIKKEFTDSLGNFHQDEYVKQLRDPRNDSIVRVMEEDARTQIRNLKWQQAMAVLCRATDTEAYIRFMTDSAKALTQIIKFPAQETPQQSSQISPNDIQAYYDAHTWMYQQEEQRKFQFVRFLLIPNGRDSALVLQTANSIKEKLAETPLTPDTTKIDTVAKELADDYSDLPPFSKLITVREIGKDTALLSSKPGDAVVTTVSGKISALRVMGVFDDNGPMLFHVRHIPIQFPAANPQTPPSVRDSALLVANQILAKIKSGADFAEVARTSSPDPRTAASGGDMGWQDSVVFPPMLRSYLGTATPGETIGPVETPQGFEIFQVMQRSRRSWAVVGVPLQVKASHQTMELESQMANLFRDQAKKKGFEQAATSAGYHLVTDAPAISQKGNPVFYSHLFVDWAFESSEGDISQAFQFTKLKSIVVAQLTKIIPAGPKPLEEVKSQIADALALRKAVAAMAPRAQQVRAMIGDSGNMEVPASTTGDQSLAPVTILMGPAESVNGLPSGEYVINNWAFSAKPGSVSPPLKGEHGYYIVKLAGRVVPTQQQFLSARATIMKKLLQEKQQRLLMDWVKSKKDIATIQDFRIKQR